MTIEDLLREAAAKGLTHLTLYPVFSEDGKKTYWHARATPSTMHSYVQITTTDPVESVQQVLNALPKARKKQPTVTAAVNPQPEESEIDKWLPKT